MYDHQNRKFGFIKIDKHVKVKVKLQLHLSIRNHVKPLLAILMVMQLFSYRFTFLFRFCLGKELFGREVRVTLCPRRMYNMQKQNTPFNPAAPPASSTSMVKPISTNINANIATTDSTATSTAPSTPTPTATVTTSTTTSTTSTTTSTSTPVTTANPIATISSSTHGLSRQMNHSLFKLRQTPEQQRGLLPTPPIPL